MNTHEHKKTTHRTHIFPITFKLELLDILSNMELGTGTLNRVFHKELGTGTLNRVKTHPLGKCSRLPWETNGNGSETARHDRPLCIPEGSTSLEAPGCYWMSQPPSIYNRPGKAGAFILAFHSCFR